MMCMASHTPAQRKGKPPDLADYLIDLHRNDPMFLPETDLGFPIAAAMVASIYLGSALAFSIFSMVRDPVLYDKVYREAESIFGNGRQPEDGDFNFDKASVTNRLWMECPARVPGHTLATADNDEFLHCRRVQDSGQYDDPVMPDGFPLRR